MGNPGADMIYGGMDAANMMGGPSVGAQARIYGAAAKPAGNGMPRGAAAPKSGSSSELCNALGVGSAAGSGGGNWVHIMDPDGKVYLVNQAAGGAGAGAGH